MIAALALALLLVDAPAHPLEVTPCGDPAMVSDSYWSGPAGTARRVLDWRTIELRADDGRTYAVALAGVRRGDRKASEVVAELERLLVGKRIETSVHGYDELRRRFAGIVHAGGKNVAMDLIERRFLRAERTPQLTHYDNCMYEYAQRGR